ncbi:ABC transporter permease [Parvibaculum sp.]|uniref:ABC transporter permease n=1 Tax=Parvibaculum sp. TaxID=2024848 RepID=UPI0025F577E8|nr:ABC transporter permease [Parvibaculum sp.]
MQHTRIIRPNDRLNEGMFSATRHMLRELLQHRGHIRAVFKQDFRNIYHGTFLGVAWNIVLPLVPISVFALLSRHRVLPNFDGVDPGTYVALGSTVWFLLAGCIQQPLQTVRARNIEVMKTALPLSAMVVSSFAQILFDTTIRLVLVAIMVVLSATELRWSALLIPVVFLPAIMLFFGIGLILGVANVIYADVGRVTGILLQYGIFISGVIFPVSSLPFSNILIWNPAYVLIEGVRELCFRGLPESGWVLGAYSVLGLIVFFFGCRLFYLMEYRVRGID